MATVETVLAYDQLKGKSPNSNLRVYRFYVQSVGTYLTGAKPNFDILAALQQKKQDVSAVDVKKVVSLDDYNVAGTVYTASNAVIALSGTGNKVVTFTVESGATGGDTGVEVADGTALAAPGVFGFLAVLSETSSAGS